MSVPYITQGQLLCVCALCERVCFCVWSFCHSAPLVFRSIPLLGLDPTFITMGWIRAKRQTWGGHSETWQQYWIERAKYYLKSLIFNWWDQRMMWSVNDFHVLDSFRPVKGREQREEQLPLFCVYLMCVRGTSLHFRRCCEISDFRGFLMAQLYQAQHCSGPCGFKLLLYLSFTSLYCQQSEKWSTDLLTTGACTTVCILSLAWGMGVDLLVCQSATQSTTLVQTKISQQLADGLPWNFVQRFIILTGWILLTLLILWPFF